jgi:hypothetical protein
MSNIIFENNFPNVIVFTHCDMDGLFSAMTIKYKYDNNLQNDSWERNVTCNVCSYGEKYRSLDWFKERVNESWVDEMENIVYMTDYAIQPNELMIQFWNWILDKGGKLVWIDHHITAIQNLRHIEIPGLQHSAYSGCMNTWHHLYGNENIPMCIRFANDFDTWNKKSEYSWDKQLYPLCYFVQSLGIDLNDNQNELVQTCYEMLLDNTYTDKCINVGKYIYRYLLSEYKLASRKIYEINWNDYNCLLINSSFKGSTQFEQYENYKDYDIMISWSFTGNSFQYGLYTTKPYINVGELAATFLNGRWTYGCCRWRNKRVCFS